MTFIEKWKDPKPLTLVGYRMAFSTAHTYDDAQQSHLIQSTLTEIKLITV